MNTKKISRIILCAFFAVSLFFAGTLCFAQSYSIEGTYDVYGTNPGGSLYGGTVKIVKSGSSYSFEWSVGESYSGTGTLQGNKLTVDWGDDHPVIYMVKENGRVLIGTWADGAATETLCRQGNVYKGVDVKGTYQVQGTNPDGSVYRGTVTVTRSGSGYNFQWSVGESYSGTGTMNQEMLTVDWGDDYPVIYEVREGGNVLIGIWANGKATEVLYK
ncbi:MAG: hypothetical protein JW822_14365 [Spirochaetales bacterium]|nr:hypothetical protein [Spirochaetales bacterium]